MGPTQPNQPNQAPPVNPSGSDTSGQTVNPASGFMPSNSVVYPIESLEVREPGQPNMYNTPPVYTQPTMHSVPFSRRKAAIVSLVITGVVSLFAGTSIAVLSRRDAKSPNSAANSVPTQDLKLKNPIEIAQPPELKGTEESLLINGDVITRGSLQVADDAFVAVFSAKDLTANQTLAIPDASGTLCLDSNNCSYASLADLQQLRNQLGQIVVAPAGVVSLNGRTGAITVQGTTNQVTVTNAGGTITFSTPQDLAPASSPTFTNMILSGTLTLPLDCTTFLNGGALTTNVSGQIVCSNDETSGAGTSVTTLGGTAGRIPVFSGSATVEDSIISQAMGNISIAGSLSLSTALSVANGGTGATTLASNGVLIGHGTSALTSVTAAGSGLCLVSTVGAPSFQTCPGANGVTSLNTLTTDLILVGTTNQITVNDNGTDTITLALTQDIATSSTPTFAGLTVSGLGSGVVRSSGGVLSVGLVNVGTEVTGTLAVLNGGTGATSAVAARGNLGAAASGVNNDITSITGLTTALSVSQGGTGVTGTPTNGQLLIGNGTNFSVSALTAGAGISVTNGAGTITIAAPSAGSCSGCANTSLSNLSSVAIQGDHLKPGTAGAINLGSGTLPFGDLFINGGVANSNHFRFTGTPTAANVITIPDASGILCLSTGNCAGAGTSVTVSSPGTSRTISMFTGNQTIANSIITQNVSDDTITVAGDLDVSGLLSASNFNGITLVANANGFQISGGTTSHTLTITADSTINQNLRTTDGPTFASLTLSSALTVTNGGTGLNSGPTADGQLLIGTSGGSYVKSTIAAGAGIVVTNGAGSIQISAPTAGTCTSGCADQSLSNLSGVNINTSLLPNVANNVDLGSNARPFRDLYIGGTANNNFRFTGTAGAAQVITLADLSGTLALVQTAGASSAQTGDLNVSGTLIAGTRLQGSLVATADTNSVSSNTANITIRSGNASGTTSNSGNLTIDAGSATGTKGTITIAGTNASTLTLGRSSLVAQIPGGINTNVSGSNGSITLGSGTITTSGAITSGAINGQTIGNSSVFNNTVEIQGANALTLGTASSVNGAAVFRNQTGANTVTLRSSNSNPSSSFSIILPSALPGVTTECLTLATSGQIGTQSCAAGIGGSGTNNQIPVFTSGGTQLADSIINQNSNTITIQGASSSLVVAGGFNTGSGTASLSLGTASSRTGAVTFNNETNANTVTIQSGTTSSSYSLILPTALDTSGKCLNVGAGGQIGYFACVSSGGGGGGSGVTADVGTDGYVVRWVNNAFKVSDSVIQDNGSRVGVNVAPDATAILTVGSGAAFKVTNAGALTVAGITNSSGGINNSSSGITNTGSIAGATTITANGLIQTSASNQAITASGAPTNSATQSLVQVGGAIASGNTTTNGGTYIGLNAPNSGAGSAADFVNFQKNGTSELLINNSGDITGGTYNGLTLSQGASQFSVQGGTGTARTLNVTTDVTLNQNLSTTSSVTFNSATLTTALGIGSGGTGIATTPSADGQLLIGGSDNTYALGTLTAGSGVSINNSGHTITISAPTAGTCSTCADKQLSNLTGTTAIPVHLLGVTAGTINLGSASVPFKDLYLAGSSGTPGTNNFTITGTATAPRTLTLPNLSGTICVDGSCAGLGNGAVVSSNGTANTLAMFTATNAIANSIFSQNVGATQGTVTGTLDVTGDITTNGNVEGLGLQANVTGFQISGGSTNSRTLTVSANATIDQNLSTSSSVTFNSLQLTTMLSAAYGGTGVNASAASNGQLLIGTGSGLSLSTLTQGSGITITNGSGSITISAPNAGSCSSCASTSLNNLSSVAIQGDNLKPGTAGAITLGTNSLPFGDLYIGGAATNNFHFNTSSATAARTITFDNLDGRLALVQTAGGSTAQTGDINVSGALISNNLQTSSISLSNTTSGSATLVSISNNQAGYTGNLIDLQAGASPTSKLKVTYSGQIGINTGASAPTADITFGNGAGRTINIIQASSGVGNSLTIQAGQGATSGNQTGGDLTLQAGAGGGSGITGSVIVKANGTNSTTAFQIQQTDGTPLFIADTTTAAPVIKIGTSGSPTFGSTTRLFTTVAEVSTTLRVGTANDGVSYNDTSCTNCSSNASKLRLRGTGRNDVTVALKPEFDGAIFSPKAINNTASGSNTGYLTSGYCSNEGSVTINSTACNTGEDHSYYEWTHNETSDQDYYMYVRYKVPSNFDSNGTFSSDVTVRGFSSKSASSSDNFVTMALYNDAGAQCGGTTTITNSTANQWGSGTTLSSTSGDSDCDGIDAGEYVTFVFQMKANSTGTTGEIIRLGEIEITYKSVF